MSLPSNRPRIVLAGAGHAHLYTINRTAELRKRGIDLFAIAPDLFWYSGLATGMLGGVYPPELDQIDVAKLVRVGGGEFISGRLSGIDQKRREIIVDGQHRLRFDALSLNLGSDSNTLPGENSQCFRVKPIRRLFELRQNLEVRFQDSVHTAIAVAGTGVTAFEVAGNLAALAARNRAKATITLYGPSPLRELPDRAAQQVLRNFAIRGIHVRSDQRADRIEGTTLYLRSGERVSFDILVIAAGLTAPDSLPALGLRTDRDGRLAVTPTLQSVFAPEVFASGDCASIQGFQLPRIGVYAIRQSPVLYRNLIAAVERRPMEFFAPQKNYLSIMTLGDGNGLAVRGKWWWFGKASFLLKDWIDRRFLEQYRVSGGKQLDA